MAKPRLKHRLTTLDATFLYYEKKSAPLHIGSVSVFDGEIPFARFVDNVEARLHLLPRYLQVAAPPPLHLGHPRWEADPDFDIRRHIFELHLEPPGSEDQLRELAGQLFGEMLPRDKPLWEIYIIHGVEGNRAAMLLKVHHAMVDGISGVDLLKIVLDTSPVPGALPKPVPYEPPLPPDLQTEVIDSVLDTTEEGLRGWIEVWRELRNIRQDFRTEAARKGLRRIRGRLPRLFLPPAPLPFNGSLRGRQQVAWSQFPFAEIRAIRAALNGTVNDVVLTVLSGAVARYIQARGVQPEGRHLRLMIPVSMRREEERGTLGNVVSILPLDIPLALADPVARFKFIQETSQASKEIHLAQGVNLLRYLAANVPPPIQAVVGAVGRTARPIFNMVCTNVPGPQVPLYVLGKRMIAYYPYVPIAHRTGCNCAILSYDQNLAFGLTADTRLMPDVERFKAFLDEAYLELRVAAGVLPSEPVELQPKPGPPDKRLRPSREK
ncbi:MAG: wax ester/triacylglycerol synthase family O-acyltransferase [Anaerolineae bacterium]